MSDTNGQISRRSLVKGAAWAVPVIALASPVPAYAASQTVCPSYLSTGIVATTNDSMTVRFDFDIAATSGYHFRVLGISGVSFTGVNGSTSFPQDFTLGVPNLVLPLNRSNSGNTSGRVSLTVQTLSGNFTPCNSPTIANFNFVRP